jgi:superoxide dismutase
MAFELPPLPYPADALEPHIDAQTMTIHHDKHHGTYVNNLNAAVDGTEFANLSPEDLIKSLDRVPEDKRTAVRNNGGGHVNHTMFWETMTPGGEREPGGTLADAMQTDLGGLSAVQEAVNAAGLARFGSGWIPWGAASDDSDELVAAIPRMRDAVASHGRDPLELGVAGKLPNVLNADGSPHLGATIDGLAPLLTAGVTDARLQLPVPDDVNAAEDYLTPWVLAFREATRAS